MSDGGDRGAGGAAVELDDVGVDAVLGEQAERFGDIGRGVHDVGRRDRDADVDLAHRRAVGGILSSYLGRNRDTGGSDEKYRNAAKSYLHIVPLIGQNCL